MYFSNLAIRNRTTIFLLLIIIIIVGSVSYRDMPLESSPDVTIPYVIVSTPYFGVSPSDIETLVTVPIENELKNLSDVEEIRSTSAEGVSIIVIEFTPEADIDDALQKTRDKVNLAKPDLPADAEEPIVQEINIAEFPIMVVNISGDIGLIRLKEIADDLSDRVEGIPGVLDVEVTGGLEREIRVEFFPDRLASYHLSYNDLVQAIEDANVNMPAGNMLIGEADLLLRVPGEFSTPREIENVVVAAQNHSPVYIRDVAKVVDTFKEPKTYARLNSEESVSLSIQKRTGENIVRICDDIKAILADFRADAPRGVTFTVAFDESKDIRRILADLNNNIISGFILVVAVIFIFMGVANALFVAVAIPLSMLITFFILHFAGITLNMVVLFSLILVVGMLVDNAVVIVENIYRHMQMGKKRVRASMDGASEMAAPVIASTLTTIAAFVPLLFWTGIMGEFMWYLPVTVITALSASLFIALVANPTITSKFMRLKKKDHEVEFDEFTGLARKPGHIPIFYEKILRSALKYKKLTIFNSFALLIVIIFAYGFLGKGVEFFPDTDPNRANINVKTPEGTNLDTTDALVKEIECCFLEYPDITHYISSVGSATDRFGGGMSTKSNRATVSIDFIDRHLRERNSREVVEAVRHQLSTTVGAELEINKQEHGPPSGKPVNIEISGEEFDALGSLAEEVRKTIKDIPGLVDLKDDYDRGRPEIRFRVDKEQASLLGFSTGSVAMALRAAVNGVEAGAFREEDEEYDIVVRLPRELRDDVNVLGNMLIGGPGGIQVPLSTLTDIDYTSGLGSIRRIDSKRVITVESEVEGRLANDVLNDVKAAVAGMKLPNGYAVSYTGQDKEQKKAEAFLKRAFWITVLLIFLVIVTQFNALTAPVIIMTSVLLSLVGVLSGLIITRTPFGIIMTGIGVISLAGVVVNNAIVLMDTIVKYRKQGLDVLEATVTAGKTRLRPVMLTAITTILGLLPLATGVAFDFFSLSWEIGGESSQWWGPMAVAVVFGLAFATILTLIVVPSLYLAIESAKARLLGGPTPEEVKS